MEAVIQFTSAFLAQSDRDPDTQDKYGPDYYNDPRAITLARLIEADLGVREIEILGGGSFGIAAATAPTGGDVIKLTLDSSEVESATVLTNTALDAYPRNVVHVQGAWYIRKLRIFADSWFDPRVGDEGEQHHANKRIGLVRMERVHALDMWEDMRAIQGLAEYTRYAKHQNKVWPHQTRGLSRAAIRERYLRAGKQLEKLLMGVSEIQQAGIAKDVARAIAQLRDIGIYGTDFHGGNVGWVPALGAKPEARERSNPVEETMQYRGVHFDLITSMGPGAFPGAEPLAAYRVRIANEQEYGPFGDRDQAIQFAHDHIDKVLGTSSPVPEAPEPSERLYKVFDVGMSSAPPTAPKPREIGKAPRSRKAKKPDQEPFSAPIAPSPVKVAELG